MQNYNAFRSGNLIWKISTKTRETVRKKITDPTHKYDKDDHRDWCDVNNSSITHYVFHPDVLPRDNIWFDIFHLRSAITKLLMQYLCQYLEKQSHELIQDYTKLALIFWGEYHVSVWRLNKKSSLFNGNKNAICKGLLAWGKITPFLDIAEYESDAHYAQVIIEYKVNVQTFYAAGENLYLQPKDVEGGGETSYCHTLRFYMLQFAKETWDNHRLGLGIFTMQGFERRNKESKIRSGNLQTKR